ncbi:ribbon-helix-helix protein, CopG family, partial [Pasteurella multocida]
IPNYEKSIFSTSFRKKIRTGDYRMSYEKLSEKRKKDISANANAYSKEKYKSINLKLSKEILDEFDSLCQTENCSRPEMLKKMLDFYKK